MHACVCVESGGQRAGGRAGACMSNAGVKQVCAECGGEGRAGGPVLNAGAKAYRRRGRRRKCGAKVRRVRGHQR